MANVEARIKEVFYEAGTVGFVHAREVGGDHHDDVCVGADDGVVLASVFKIPVLVGFVREVAAGRLDDTEPATVTARYRTGGIGTAGCADDVQMSWRDLARNMMTMSDNAATDVIYHRLGKSTVDQVLIDLGLDNTQLTGCCEDLFATMADDAGMESTENLDAALEALTAEETWRLGVLDPTRTTASTPRDITELLDAIWTNRVAPAAACERARNIMAEQIWPHRLSAGFDSDVQIAAKTGTLPGIRNEAGVVTYPDERRYAVAVFTRANSLAQRQPRIDASIGTAARMAVEHLR